MRHPVLWLVALNAILALIVFGHIPYLYAFLFLSQLSLVLIGIAKERHRWPFSKPRVVWPFGVVGFLSATVFASLWNKNAIDHVLLLWPAALAVIIGIAGTWRGWMK